MQIIQHLRRTSMPASAVLCRALRRQRSPIGDHSMCIPLNEPPGHKRSTHVRKRTDVQTTFSPTGQNTCRHEPCTPSPAGAGIRCKAAPNAGAACGAGHRMAHRPLLRHSRTQHGLQWLHHGPGGVISIVEGADTAQARPTAHRRRSYFLPPCRWLGCGGTSRTGHGLRSW